MASCCCVGKSQEGSDEGANKARFLNEEQQIVKLIPVGDESCCCIDAVMELD